MGRVGHGDARKIGLDQGEAEMQTCVARRDAEAKTYRPRTGRGGCHDASAKHFRGWETPGISWEERKHLFLKFVGGGGCLQSAVIRLGRLEHDRA